VLFYAGGYPDADVTFYWGTEDGKDEPTDWDRGSVALGPKNIGAIWHDLNSLVFGETFYYRFHVTITGGNEAWSETQKVTLPGAPALGAPSETVEIANSLITMRCELEDVGGTPTDVTLWFGTDSGAMAPVASWNGVMDAPREFVHTENNLDAGHIYYYAFSATNVMVNGTVMQTWTATKTIRFATERMWIGAGSMNWNVPGNWSPVGVPGATEVAVFTDTGTFGSIIALNGDRAVYKILISSQYGFTIGNTYDRTNYVLRVTDIERTATAAGDHIFGLPVKTVPDANGNAAWAAGNAGTLRMAGSVQSDAGCLVTKTGAATLYLSHNANAFNGTWHFLEGMVVADAGDAVRNPVTIGGGDTAAELRLGVANVAIAHGRQTTVTVLTNGYFNTNGYGIGDTRIGWIHAKDGGRVRTSEFNFYCFQIMFTGGTSEGGDLYGQHNQYIRSYASDMPAVMGSGFRCMGQWGNNYHTTVYVEKGGVPVGLVITKSISHMTVSPEPQTTLYIEKTGAGVLRLMASNPIGYLHFNHRAGTVLFDNETGTGTGHAWLRVDAGATLGGTGFIGGTSDNSNVTLNNGNVSNFATLAPGTIDSDTGAHIIGTLTVGSVAQTNNVTLGNHSLFRASIGEKGENDRLTVFGETTISTTGTTLDITTMPKTKGGPYTLISAENGVANQFATVVVNGETGTRYTKRVTYTPTEVIYNEPLIPTLLIIR